MQKRKKTTMKEHDVMSLLAQEESKEAAALLRGMLTQSRQAREGKEKNLCASAS